MNQNSLVLRRSLKKTLRNLFFFLAAEAAASFLFAFFFLPSPQTSGEKAFASVSFCVYVLLSLFLAGYILDSVRNLIEPSVRLSPEDLWLSGMAKPVLISEITAMEITGDEKMQIFTVFCADEKFSLRQKDCQLPLYTLKQAVLFRMEDAGGETPEDVKNAG